MHGYQGAKTEFQVFQQPLRGGRERFEWERNLVDEGKGRNEAACGKYQQNNVRTQNTVQVDLRWGTR